MNFDLAFSRLLGQEGGFTDDRQDKGNWTGGKVGVGALKGSKYGISAMSYPMEDIRNLSEARAKAIYLRDFWGPAGCDLVPTPLKYPLFETAVHTSAPGRPTFAIKLVQRAAGVQDDGIIGPITMQAISSADPYRLTARFYGFRLDHLNDLPAWAHYSKGWAQRIADNLKEL